MTTPTPSVTRDEKAGDVTAGQLAVVCIAIIGASASLFVEPVLATVFLLVPSVVAIGKRSRRDAVTVLTVVLITLVVIPSNLVIGPLGAAGRPAGVLGMIALWWWAHEKLLPASLVSRGRQPVRIVMLLLLFAIVLSYAVAFHRSITPEEASSADRGVLTMLGYAGMLLLAADGIADRDRLDTFLRRLIIAATFMAAIGALQFFTGANLDAFFDFPGLTKRDALQGIQNRSDLNRVSATAAHPIEFGVVLGMIFPLAVHYAGLPNRRRYLRWGQVALIAAAIPMSVSRSGILAVGTSALVIWLAWPVRRKIRTAIVTAVFLVAVRLAVPGLLGTIRSLFTNFFVDDSVAGRTSDYPLVGRYLTERPMFGRGFATFIPDKNFVLDNQYLGMLIETGVVGTTLFLAVLIAGICTARGSRRFADPDTRSLGQALAAAILASLICAATFDLLAFGIAAGTTFLLIGCAGALWRITAPAREGRSGRHVAAEPVP